MPHVRTFVAAPLGDAASRALAGMLQELKKREPSVKWIRPENLHWTLAFLGGLEEARIENVRQACQDAAEATFAFALRLGSLGRFPAQGSPRVIWTGLSQGAEALTALQARLLEALERKEFHLESREFVPHLTLGRVPRHTRLSGETSWLSITPPETGTIPVTELLVMRSELSPSAARYTQLHVCPLLKS